MRKKIKLFIAFNLLLLICLFLAKKYTPNKSKKYDMDQTTSRCIAKKNP